MGLSVSSARWLLITNRNFSVYKEKNNLTGSKDKPEPQPSESHQVDSEEILKAMDIASEGIKSTLNIFKK